MDCIDLTQKTKILGIHFSFNKKLETRKLYHVRKIENTKVMGNAKFDHGRKN